MLIMLVIALGSLLALWLTVIGIMPLRLRLWLAKHPFAFLLIHIPFMVFMTSVGGEGLLFGVSNLAAGIVAQFVLAWWGVRYHGLTWGGRKTNLYFALHPRKLDVDVVRKYVHLQRVIRQGKRV
jgi:hypothetical protein